MLFYVGHVVCVLALWVQKTAAPVLWRTEKYGALIARLGIAIAALLVMAYQQRALFLNPVSPEKNHAVLLFIALLLMVLVILSLVYDLFFHLRDLARHSANKEKQVYKKILLPSFLIVSVFIMAFLLDRQVERANIIKQRNEQLIAHEKAYEQCPERFQKD